MKMIPRNIKMDVLLVTLPFQVNRAVDLDKRGSVVLVRGNGSNRDLADGPSRRIWVQSAEAVGEKKFLPGQVKRNPLDNSGLPAFAAKFGAGEGQDLDSVLQMSSGIFDVVAALGQISAWRYRASPQQIR